MPTRRKGEREQFTVEEKTAVIRAMKQVLAWRDANGEPRCWGGKSKPKED